MARLGLRSFLRLGEKKEVYIILSIAKSRMKNDYMIRT